MKIILVSKNMAKKEMIKLKELKPIKRKHVTDKQQKIEKLQ